MRVQCLIPGNRVNCVRCDLRASVSVSKPSVKAIAETVRAGEGAIFPVGVNRLTRPARSTAVAIKINRIGLIGYRRVPRNRTGEVCSGNQRVRTVACSSGGGGHQANTSRRTVQ